MDSADSITGMKGEPGDVLHTFFIAPGRCFRMVKSATSEASHCAEPVTWKGPWRDVMGELWTVEACERHKPTDGIARIRSAPLYANMPDRERFGAN